VQSQLDKSRETVRIYRNEIDLMKIQLKTRHEAEAGRHV
jgi:hypothetical protein